MLFNQKIDTYIEYFNMAIILEVLIILVIQSSGDIVLKFVHNWRNYVFACKTLSL